MMVSLALLLMMTNCVHAQLSAVNKGCLLQLAPEENGGKVNFYLQCPSCQAMHPLDISNCDIYEDLEIDTNCTGDGCVRDYRLYDTDYSFSTTVTEDGERSTVMLAMGAVVGILVLLLGVVLNGWVWTCWKLKKVAKKNSTQVKSKVEKTDKVKSESKQEPRESSSGPMALVLHDNAAYECTTSLISSIQNASKCKDITDKDCDKESPSEEDILVHTP